MSRSVSLFLFLLVSQSQSQWSSSATALMSSASATFRTTLASGFYSERSTAVSRRRSRSRSAARVQVDARQRLLYRVQWAPITCPLARGRVHTSGALVGALFQFCRHETQRSGQLNWIRAAERLDSRRLPAVARPVLSRRRLLLGPMSTRSSL